MERIQRYIWLLSEPEDGFQPGYYFEDECEQLNGPYSTAQDAFDALQIYSSNL